MKSDDDESVTYRVVTNHEEQYSIWPADRENPPGWRDGGKTGTKAECLGYINDVWTDMRPLSLRKRMQEATRCDSPGGHHGSRSA
jgi:MbtH protein